MVFGEGDDPKSVVKPLNANPDEQSGGALKAASLMHNSRRSSMLCSGDGLYPQSYLIVFDVAKTDVQSFAITHSGCVRSPLQGLANY